MPSIADDTDRGAGRNALSAIGVAEGMLGESHGHGGRCAEDDPLDCGGRTSMIVGKHLEEL